MSEHVEGVGEVTRRLEHGIGPDGGTLRVYHPVGDESGWLPSVTSVLKFLDLDETGLEIWKDQNDVSGDDPDWRHILWYKQNRGTLCHYVGLNPLAERELWSSDEHGSARQYITLDDSLVDNGDIHPGAIIFSIWRDWGLVENRMEFIEHVHHRSLQDEGDVKWALSRLVSRDMRLFEPHWDEACSALGIDDESVVDVERFLFCPDLGVAGQADLVYDAPDGARVLADLKTSAGLYEKHTLQATLYAEMLPFDIDRIEVIRCHPRDGWTVYTPPETESDRGVLTADSGYDSWDLPRADLWERCQRAIDRAGEGVGR